MQNRKRTPIEIYNERASQQDFCPLKDISDYFIYFILNAEAWNGRICCKQTS